MLERQKQQTSATLHPHALTNKPLEVSGHLALGGSQLRFTVASWCQSCSPRRNSKAQSYYPINAA